MLLKRLHRLFDRSLPRLLPAGIVLIATAAFAAEDPWPGLRSDIFGAQEMIEGDGSVQIYAPDNAEDAALWCLSPCVCRQRSPTP